MVVLIKAVLGYGYCISIKLIVDKWCSLVDALKGYSNRSGSKFLLPWRHEDSRNPLTSKQAATHEQTSSPFL